MSSVSSLEVFSIKSRILDLFVELEESELNAIEQWICTQSYKEDLEKKKHLLQSEKTLIEIGSAIKKLVPFESVMSTEKILNPTVGDLADCNDTNTCNVDEFLYDQEQIDKLVKRGKLKRHYCLDCHSRNVEDLIYISHSMSRQVLQCIFKYLLPDDLEGKQILDIGSRFGSVIFSAYHLTNASTIIGIEMNNECCDIQNKIIDKFNMDRSRIKVICADVMDQADIVAQSDVIILNVLDFFVDTERHKQIWYFCRKYFKKGSYFVCNRAITETLSSLDIYEELSNWFTICKPNQMDNEIFFDPEDCIYLYQVSN